ncbi:MAG: glycosyltransferase family 4 protein [Nitrospirae bacterium]|nr:glycosyltransferase family 4 protein [Nitrospirota bacterium]
MSIQRPPANERGAIPEKSPPPFPSPLEGEGVGGEALWMDVFGKGSKMRVLMISRDARLAERGDLNDVQLRHIAYASRVDRMDILVGASGARTPSFALDAKVSVHPVVPGSPLAFPAAALARWRAVSGKLRPDVITAQDPFVAGWAGLALAKWLHVPLNVQVHSDQLDNPYYLREAALNRVQNRLAKTVLKRAQTIRVVNRRTMEQCRALGMPDRRCLYIPLVFGLEPFFAARAGGSARKSLLGRLSKTCGLILFAGRLSWEKGWDVFLESMRELSKEKTAVKAVFVGSGPDAPKAARLASRWGLEDSVQFLGWRPYGKLPGYYAAADVCVVPSWHEGFGRSTLEAQAAGRAVIATATAGTADLIRAGRTGIVIPVGDASALSGAIRELLADADGRARVGELARKEARERWSDYDLPGELAAMFEKTAAMR